MKKRFVSMLLVMCMVFTMLPTAFAQETHVHDLECGFVERAEGSVCVHEHNDTCAYVEASEGTPCDKECAEEHKDCAYMPSVDGNPCSHGHDESCEYIEAVPGQLCKYDTADATKENDCICESKCDEESTDESCEVCKQDNGGCTASDLEAVPNQNDSVMIGSTRYASLVEAVAAASSNDTIQLVQNIEMGTGDIMTVPEDKVITLDLNQKTISVTKDFEGRPIVNEGTLTITGNGIINSSNSEFDGYGAVDNYGDLTIENGTYTGSVYADGASVKNRAGGVLVINGGIFDGGTRALSNEGIATVNGGDFSTTSCTQTTASNGSKEHWAYAVVSTGELYFNNGSVTGVQGALALSSGYAEVKDGVFQTVGCEHSDKGAYSFYALYIAGEKGAVEAHISGGTYESVSKVAVLAGNDNLGGDGGINAKATAHISGGTFTGAQGQGALKAGKNTGDPRITGGTFNSDVSAHVPDGYKQTDNKNGTYTIAALDAANAAAQINGVYYATLQEALEAVKAGETIHILAGTHAATENEQLRVDKPNVTLQGVGDTSIIDAATYSSSGQGGLLVTADNVTLKDLKVISNSVDGNVAAIKFMQQNGPLPTGKVENVTVSSVKGHGLNVHGVADMVVSGLKVENAGKCGAAFTNSANVSVSGLNTEGLTLLWGDVGLMYKNNAEHVTKTTVTFSGSNTFGTGKVYSERPTSAEGGQDVIKGLNGADGWIKTVDNSGIAYQKGSVVAFNGTTGDGYVSIDGALAAAKAGETVHIMSGTHTITGITVPSGVTLTSATNKAEDVVLVGTEVANTVTLSTNAKLRAVTVTRDNGVAWNDNPVSQGVLVAQNTVGATIENCIVKETRNGIYANNTNVTIKNTLLQDNRTGIQLANNVSGIISDNVIKNNRTMGLLLGATNDALSENGYKNLIISSNTFEGNWYAQVENRAPVAASINLNGNTFTSPVTLVKEATAGEPDYNNWVDTKPSDVDPNRLVNAVDGNIVYDDSVPPASDIVSKVEDITTQLPPASDIGNATEAEKEAVTKQVDAVVEMIQTMTEEEKQEVTETTIQSLEEVLIAANPNVTESKTSVDTALSGTLSGDVGVTGAALSVPSDVTTPVNAELSIAPSQMPTLPTDIVNAVALEINLNLTNENGQIVSSEIQPVAPIVITMPIPAGVSTKDLVILHYHGGTSTPERLVPTIDTANNRLSVRVSGFSTFVFANIKATDGGNSGSSGGGGSSYKYYNVSVTKEGKGTITPDGGDKGTVSLRERTEKTFTFTPDEGYKVSEAFVDGKAVDVEKSYTFKDVKENHTLKVIFTAKDGEEATETEVDSEDAAFTDVKESDWFYSAVKESVEKGWFAGTSETTFGPSQPTSRGMIATVLWRMENKPEVAVAAAFEDVSAGSWYYNGVAWAQENGIVGGYGNGKYGPEDQISREQLASILYRYAQKTKGLEAVTASENLTSFNDADSISPYAVSAMNWAVESGLISGKGNGILDPKGNATRAEVASLLVRFDKLFAEEV